MAKINIICESCGTGRKVDELLAGSVLPCANCEASIRVPIPNIAAGVTLGGFVLEKQLGFGAMGEVWLARQLAMDRKVALKLLSREYTLDSSFIDRFLKEVRISAKMDHPNIITAFDAGCDNDIHYLAITYVDGCTLEDQFEKGGALPEKEALGITLAIAEALQYAWAEFQLIHRDIKPANIMIDAKGAAKLMDMGISKSANECAGLTMAGTIIGTPYYMSPEQGTGDGELDFHSDIYSLGATLYHIVTGVLPFDATTALGIVSKHITEPLPSPLDKNPNISEQCSSLIEIMMTKSKGDRQDSWAEVVSDIRMVLEGKFPTSKPRPSPGDSLIMPAAHSQSTMEDVSEEGMPTNIEGDDVVQSQTKPKSKGVMLFVIAAGLIFVGVVLTTMLLMPRQETEESTDENVLLAASPIGVDEIESTNLSDESSMTGAESASKPEKTPIATSAGSSKQRHEEQLRRCKEMIEFATKYASENPTSYDMAIKNFQELAKVAAGTKYQLMANVSIAKLEDGKKAAIAKVFDDLAKLSTPLSDKHQFNEAEKLYLNYSGLMEEETKTERERIANEYKTKAAKFATTKKAEEDALESKRKNNTYAIAANMASGNWSGASSNLKKMGLKSKKAKKLQPILDELLNIKKSLISNLKKQVGKTVTVEIKNGTKRIKVSKVKGKYIYHKEKKGKVVVLKKYSASRLTPNEYARVAGLSAPACLAYFVSGMVEKGDFSQAVGTLSKSKNSFAKFLKLGVYEILAKKVLFNILRRLDITNNERDPAAIVAKLEENPPSPLSAKKRKVVVRGYRRKFASTRFAKEYEPVLKVLETLNAETQNGSAQDPSDDDESVEDTIGGLVIGAIRKVTVRGTKEINVSNLNPAMVNSSADIRRILRKVCPDYNNGGRFIFRRGAIFAADLSDCAGLNNAGLAALSMLPLKMLDLGNTDITDLAPLKNMALRELSLAKTRIVDLSPLKALTSLKMLSLANSKVTNLLPIKNLKLKMLDISGTNIKDIRPLMNMPLEGLKMSDCKVRSYSVLRKLKKLTALEPRELWRKVFGKEQNANNPQHFPNERHQPTNDNRRRRPRKTFRLDDLLN